VAGRRSRLVQWPRVDGQRSYECGNGARVLAQDTVPFTLWTAATYLHDYPSAIIACVEAGGDVDTTAAIVGGIVASFTGIGERGVPHEWLAAREPLPVRLTGGGVYVQD
jgi:ADP-ribosylglycohydrolase